MMRILLFLIAGLCPSLLLAQTALEGDLEDRIFDVIGSLPGEDNNDYVRPTVANMVRWDTLIIHILDEQYAQAASLADTFDYELYLYTDTAPTPDVDYYLLEKDTLGSNYWGTYLFNPNADRAQLVLMSPHPRKDFNTGKEGIHCMISGGARAWFLAGTNRCNATDSSTCSGTSSVCNNSSKFRQSDLAHDTLSIWQQTTRTVFNEVAGSVFVQFHGFSKQASDPYVIMSNGTTTTPNPDYIDSLETALFDEDNVLTFKAPHKDLAWTRLVGFTNTNGRLINGSTNHCGTSATMTDGRWIHIEQEKTRLRDNEAGWDKMCNALNNVFPAALLPVGLTQLNAVRTNADVLISWTSAFELNTSVYWVEYSPNAVDAMDVGSVPAITPSSQPQTYELTHPNAPAEGTYYRLRIVSSSGDEEYTSWRYVAPLPTEPMSVMQTGHEVLFSLENALLSHHLEVFSLTGKRVATTTIGPNKSFSAEQLGTGIFFYRATASNGVAQSGRFVLIGR